MFRPLRLQIEFSCFLCSLRSLWNLIAVHMTQLAKRAYKKNKHISKVGPPAPQKSKGRNIVYLEQSN